MPQIGNFVFLRVISAVLAGVGPSSGEVLGGLTLDSRPRSYQVPSIDTLIKPSPGFTC